jgi:hypothetical protein
MTGEFANLGVVYFDAQSKELRWRFEDKKFGRLSQFFGDAVQGTYILSALKQMNKRLQKLSAEGLHRFERIEALTTSLLPPDDNGLYFSESWQGRHFEHRLAFDEIYSRIIGQYQEETIKRQDDTYAWKNVYKQYFDRYNLTSKLHKHQVKTNTDTFDFQHTCKNGVWHCIQSLSFALKNEGSIKDKIYKWDGFARELLTSKEPMKVYLLSIFPDNPELTKLLQKKLNVKDANVEIRVVGEQEADAIALELKQALEMEHP